MKLINAVKVIVKLFLSIAGIVYVANRMIESLKDDQYKFEVDSFFNKDEKEPKPQSNKDRDFHSRILRKAVFESMDV